MTTFRRPLPLALAAPLLLALAAGAPTPATALVPSGPATSGLGTSAVTTSAPPDLLPFVAAGLLPPVAGSQRHAAPAPGVWPLHPAPRVVSGFDPPLSDYGAGHRGVDLAGRRGQEVRAAAAGRVTYAGLLAGRGVVVVEHGAARTTYQPVRATVSLGTRVAAGETIGTLRTLGSHCWPATCLHWGLVEVDTYLDPLTLVGAGPVRLLPLAGGPGPARPSP